MNLDEYIKLRVGTWVKENDYFWYQCVAQVKDYSKNVLWVTLWSFWGTALTGWYNRSDTFKESVWDKIINNPKDINQVPRKWDIIFFSWPTYAGHVWVVSNQPRGGDLTFEIINQNVWNWDWIWEDDYIKISTYNYSLVLWWYRRKSSNFNENMIESKTFSETSVWKWVKVRHKEHPTIDNVNAFYSESNNTIYLTQRFFTKTIEQQESILDHEWGHSVWYRLPKVVQDLWILYHYFDIDLQKKIKERTGRKFTECRYLNASARRNERESFSEFIELATLDRLSWKETIFDKSDWVSIWYSFSRNIMKKINDREILLK